MGVKIKGQWEQLGVGPNLDVELGKASQKEWCLSWNKKGKGKSAGNIPLQQATEKHSTQREENMQGPEEGNTASGRKWKTWTWSVR